MRFKSAKSIFYLLKSAFLAGFLLLLVFPLLAQTTDTIVPVDENPEKLLRNIRIGSNPRTGLSIYRDKFSGHYAGVDFGFNMFLNENYPGYSAEFMDNDVLRSNSVYINLVQQGIGIQRARNTIGLVTGIGLHLYNYRLDKNTTITRDENSVVQPLPNNFENIKKSNLAIMSLMVPLLAEFQIPVNNYGKRMYISIGLFGGVKLTSHTKVKYKLERYKKVKVADHFSIRDFNYGIMVRTGYRWVNLFATYDLVPLFRENRGPELTPFTFGITLVQF